MQALLPLLTHLTSTPPLTLSYRLLQNAFFPSFLQFSMQSLFDYYFIQAGKDPLVEPMLLAPFPFLQTLDPCPDFRQSRRGRIFLNLTPGSWYLEKRQISYSLFPLNFRGRTTILLYLYLFFSLLSACLRPLLSSGNLIASRALLFEWGPCTPKNFSTTLRRPLRHGVVALILTGPNYPPYSPILFQTSYERTSISGGPGSQGNGVP